MNKLSRKAASAARTKALLDRVGYTAAKANPRPKRPATDFLGISGGKAAAPKQCPHNLGFNCKKCYPQ